MSYKLNYTRQGVVDAAKLKKSEPKAFKKLLELEKELIEHPRTGTGKPELLKGDKSGRWSRRISQKHRLVYEIHDSKVVVIVVSAYGHYDDK